MWPNETLGQHIAGVPWQHWAVIVEQFFSLGVLAWMVGRGGFKSSGRYFAFWFPWDCTFLALFIWGEHSVNVPGVLYLLGLLAGAVSMIRNCAEGRQHDFPYERNGRTVTKTEFLRGATIFTVVLALLVVYST